MSLLLWSALAAVALHSNGCQLIGEIGKEKPADNDNGNNNGNGNGNGNGNNTDNSSSGLAIAFDPIEPASERSVKVVVAVTGAADGNINIGVTCGSASILAAKDYAVSNGKAISDAFDATVILDDSSTTCTATASGRFAGQERKETAAFVITKPTLAANGLLSWHSATRIVFIAGSSNGCSSGGKIVIWKNDNSSVTEYEDGKWSDFITKPSDAEVYVSGDVYGCDIASIPEDDDLDESYVDLSGYTPSSVAITDDSGSVSKRFTVTGTSGKVTVLVSASSSYAVANLVSGSVNDYEVKQVLDTGSIIYVKDNNGVVLKTPPSSW